MYKSLLKKTSLLSAHLLCFSPLLYAQIPVWAFSSPSPANLEISAGETATVQYVITNQSTKSKDLVLKSPLGISASPCHLETKYSTCTLSLQINGSQISPQGLHETPVLCEKNNPNQCYQASLENRLNVNLRQEPPTMTTMAAMALSYTTEYVYTPLDYYSQDDGLTWKLSTFTPVVTEYNPYGISCNNNHACVQVGYNGNIVTYSSLDNGQTWTGTLLDLSSVVFTGVYCDDNNWCIAIGNDNTIPVVYTSSDLGKTWNASSPLSTLSSDEHTLQSVTCAPNGMCMTVGRYINSVGDPQLLGYYSEDNGSTWTLSTIEGVGTPSRLNSVSCAAGTCFAVGSYKETSSDPTRPIIFVSTDNGQNWARSTSLPSIDEAEFFGISCNTQGCAISGASLTDSLFIGYYTTDGGSTWEPSSWPTSAGDFGQAFNNIVCLDNLSCVAVGQLLIPVDSRPFGYQSKDNGKTWAIIPFWPLPENIMGAGLLGTS